MQNELARVRMARMESSEGQASKRAEELQLQLDHAQHQLSLLQQERDLAQQSQRMAEVSLVDQVRGAGHGR